jgi:WD40 repeat protein
LNIVSARTGAVEAESLLRLAHPFQALAWTAAGTRLATAGRDGMLRVVNAVRGVVEYETEFQYVRNPLLLPNVGRVLNVAWSPSETKLAVFAITRTAGRTALDTRVCWYLWIANAANGTIEHKVHLPTVANGRHYNRYIHNIFTEEDDFTFNILDGAYLAWNPLGTKLAVSCLSDLCIVDAARGLVESVMKEGPELGRVTWNPSGTRLAEAISEGIRIVDVGNGLVDWVLDSNDVRFSGSAPALTWSPSGAKFATSTYHRRVMDDGDEAIELTKYCMRIVDAASGMVDHELEFQLCENERIESVSVAWNPSGTKLMIASHHSISLRRNSRTRLPYPPDHVSNYMSGGRPIPYLTLRIVDAATGTIDVEFKNGTNPYSRGALAAWDPSGTKVAVGNPPGFLLVDATSGMVYRRKESVPASSSSMFDVVDVSWTK